jgi:hypothetical protein
MMKSFMVFVIALVFTVSMSVSPVFAGGGKNHGDVGQGSTDQGTTADAPGDDAQDNQAP